MSNVTIDIVEGAQWDHTVGGSTYKRIAYVSGLDTGFASGDPSMLFRTLGASGMPQWYDVHPNNPIYICNRHVVTPETDSSCMVEIYYVSGPGSPPASTWMVTESTSPMTLSTQIDPASGTTITVLGPPGSNIPARVATFTYDISVRRLTFEGWVSRSAVPGNSTPSGPANTDVFAQAVNSVNQAPWRNYDVGYWKFNEWDDTTQDRGFSYTIRAGFITKIREDWSQYQGLHDANTGQIVAPVPTDLAYLKAQKYKYGVKLLDNGQPSRGITKAGLYPTADFAQLFGD